VPASPDSQMLMVGGAMVGGGRLVAYMLVAANLAVGV
jgi:hypothetical protein